MKAEKTKMEEVKPDCHPNLRHLFSEHQRNYIADAILEGSMGKVLVNDKETPSVAVLSLLEYRMHILGGEAQHPTARNYLAALPGFSTLFLATPEWVNLLDQVHQGKVITLKRYTFNSESLELEKLQRLRSQLPANFHIARITLPVAQQIADDKSDLSNGQLFGFASPQDFIERGFGYCAWENEKMVCLASTGTVCSKGIEVQINTHKKYRGRGLASATGAALLIECLENGINPNWDAATEISAGLAQKLGYMPAGAYNTYIYTGSRFLVNLRKFLRRIRGKEA